LLRRYQIQSEQKIVIGTTILDARSYTCQVKDQSIELTRKEFDLLHKLLSYPNVIFTRNQLMDEIWGFDSDSYDRTVDTHIKRIREQIPEDDFEIKTVRGLGYKAVIK
jgi:DNA-binding response OmpR family regulator